MAMDKHGNSFFPGDKVHKQGTKVAGTERFGSVVDQVDDKLKVKWPDGSEEYVDPAELVKA